MIKKKEIEKKGKKGIFKAVEKRYINFMPNVCQLEPLLPLTKSPQFFEIS